MRSFGGTIPCDVGYKPVNIEATEAGVQGAAVSAYAAFRFSFANVSKMGVVVRSYPYPLRWSARSVSSIKNNIFGRLDFHSFWVHEDSRQKQRIRAMNFGNLFMVAKRLLGEVIWGKGSRGKNTRRNRVA